MNKIPETKTRKRLRIALCIFYLFEIVLCAWSFIRIPSPDGTKILSRSVFEMLSYMGQTPDERGFQLTIAFFLLFPIIPIIGFFFCALERKRNLHNLVSLLCCLGGILSILLVVTPQSIHYGSLFSMLLYIFIAFLSSFSMMAWIIDNKNGVKDEDKAKE